MQQQQLMQHTFGWVDWMRPYLYVGVCMRMYAAKKA